MAANIDQHTWMRDPVTNRPVLIPNRLVSECEARNFALCAPPEGAAAPAAVEDEPIKRGRRVKSEE